MQPAQPAPHLLPHQGVERAEGLVEQQQARLDRERAGERHALALAARDLLGVAPLQLRHLHEFQQAPHAGGDLGRGRSAGGARAGRRRRCRTPSCGGTARSAGTPRRCRARAPARPPCPGPAMRTRAGIRALQPRQHPQQRGLARAGGAEQRDELALGHRERHAVERGEAARSGGRRRAPRRSSASCPPRGARPCAPAPPWRPASRGRAAPAGRRRRRRRRTGTRCRGSRHAAAPCWSPRGYGRTRPTPRRTRPSRGRCRAARPPAAPSARSAASPAGRSAARRRRAWPPPPPRRAPARPSAAARCGRRRGR